MARKNNKEKAKLYRQLSLVGIIPIIMAVGPLMGYFAGHWLDRKLGTDPYLMYLLIVLGFIAAGQEVYKVIKQVSDNTEE